MSTITGISNNYTDYGKLASGKKLMSASDGAAELAIAQKMNTQVNTYNKGIDNMGYAKSALNIADGAMGGVTDYLQRMRELAVQASNGLLGESDLRAIQDEIDQMKQGIADLAGTTNYNGKNLLDGSFQNVNIATGNSSMSISAGNATLQALGIADFDVTGNFDISQIDNALDKLGSSRSSVGAQSNALDYAIDYNSYASYNLVGAASKLEDLDYPRAISEQKKNEVLQTYSLMMQKKQMEVAATQASLLWA